MKKNLLVIFSMVCFLSGCAGLKEAAKGFAGVSTNSLEGTRKNAVKKTYNIDSYTAHKKIKDILKAREAYVYKDDPALGLIAVYVSATDTTPVGVFLTETGKNITLVEVSSPSTYGKETVSKFIFNYLDGKIGLTEGKEKANVKK